jgi:hypothetical protein
LLALVLFGLAACAPQPVRPGMMLLSNPNFGPTNVEAVVTANPDCAVGGPGYVSNLEFILPNQATKFLDVPPGTGICWRRDRDPDHPVVGEWSPWNRAHVAPGTTIDTNL